MSQNFFKFFFFERIGSGGGAGGKSSAMQIRIPMYIKVLGQPVPYPFTLLAVPIGPRIEVDQQKIDWGSVKCLQRVTKTLKVTNNSVIDASVRCLMKSKSSLWTVTPKKIHLSPGEQTTIELSLVVDEKQTVNDLLYLIVHEGNDIQVAVRAKGTGTPITSQEDLSFVDFGTVYATQTITRDIMIENRGRKARKLVWNSEKLDILKKYL